MDKTKNPSRGNVMAKPAPQLPLSLVAASREAARDRIVRAAMEALAEHGLGATVDEVATLAGVSRRTVFRYFPTHGQLMTAAYDGMWRRYQNSLPGPPAPDEDLRSWLTRTVIAVHRLNAELGAAWWSLHSPESDWSDELAVWRGEWVKSRPEVVVDFTTSAWHGVGGRGRPPRWVLETFFLQMSAFVRTALVVDGPRTPEEIGELTSRILWAVLLSAVAEDNGVSPSLGR